MTLRFELRGWNLGLEVRIWTLRLGFEPHNWDMSFEGGGRTEEKKEEEKFLLCESIGHRPLRGRCPKKKTVTIVAKALDGQR